MNDTQTAKDLVAAECQRVIDLLSNGNLYRSGPCESTSDLAELKRKMAELRRDTIRLEKLLYY
ncbi:hypothetical protein ACM1RC_26740 [Paenibacillus azoreducens]|uniref:hypothetical protein n=1 Tax=Paenibacillus azoreducens TaxID=116718 RepID=UPI0039F55C77